jgi:bacteriochlorophyll 4-vinyl reductase
MREAGIGRVLVASLHQAIADLLPTRLEFYENWLNTTGLRDGTIGLAPLSAVLSFLRSEGDAYALITARAGQYAAAWTLDNVAPIERRVIRALPAGLRARAALRNVRALVRATYPGSRAITKVKRGTVSIDLRGSLFCEVRETQILPLCGFYAAAIDRMFEAVDLRSDTKIDRCRAEPGGPRGCLLSVSLASGAAEDGAVAA